MESLISLAHALIQFACLLGAQSFLDRKMLDEDCGLSRGGCGSDYQGISLQSLSFISLFRGYRPPLISWCILMILVGVVQGYLWNMRTSFLRSHLALRGGNNWSLLMVSVKVRMRWWLLSFIYSQTCLSLFFIILS